jgi:LacI family transcriptional regulator
MLYCVNPFRFCDRQTEMRRYTHIGLVIGTDGEYARRVLRGINRYVRESGRPWLFSLTPHLQPDLKALAKWDPVGIIAHLLTADVAEQVLALGRPVVNVTSWLDHPRLARVGNDNLGVGRAGAQHFLERHFRRFAFVGWPGVPFSDQRGEGFAATVRDAGFDCLRYRDTSPSRPWQVSGSTADREHLEEWIASLPVPVAVMACNDVRAWEVLQACRALERHVPEEVAVVGADNDEVWCLLAHPPLSSVAVAAEQVGYQAAAKLERVLAGKKVHPRTVVPPLGVVTRQSSDAVAVADRTVADALRFIREHTDRPIGIGEVLEVVPVSRRALERSFRKALGRSPAEEIRQAHLRRAQDLLATTTLSMAEVAQLSGFTGSKHLSVVFRQFTGLTPTNFRGQFQVSHGPHSRKHD